jgi:hypothetical protein
MKTMLALILLAVPPGDDLARRAAAIKPTGKELTWLGIPWVTDLIEAQRLARDEKRPIFLWATGDDPFERC